MYIKINLLTKESSSELNRRIDDIHQETVKNTAQFERLANDQNRQIKDLQGSVHKLQQILSSLDVSSKTTNSSYL